MKSATPKKTIAVIVGTRPEAIKLAPVIRGLEASTLLHPLTISTSQHGQMTAQIFQNFGITPDLDLRVMRSRQSLWDLTASLSTALGDVFSGTRVDAVVVQGDTTSAFVGGLCAFYHKIPVAHVEAGLRSHNRYSPFPEEINRVMLSRLANWHFAPTDFAASLLRAENIADGSIFVSGNTVVDALQWMTRQSSVDSLPTGVAFDARAVILVTCHRRENIGTPMRSVALAIKHLADAHRDVHFIFPLHPNPSVRENVVPILADQSGISLCEPLNHDEFLAVLRRSRFVLSDSGGVQEEATALGKPVLVLRRETERPEGVAAGTLRLIGTDIQDIIRETETLLNNPAAYEAMTNGSSVFGDGHAAEHIIRVLEEELNVDSSFVSTPARGNT
ncbi:MAG: UDP-N-acetylglucosamine 2-epimerase (non-hydrolyzing) [bacterium]